MLHVGEEEIISRLHRGLWYCVNRETDGPKMKMTWKLGICGAGFHCRC